MSRVYVRTATLTDGQVLTFGKINIIVGPNSIGKSTFLRELFEASFQRERGGSSLTVRAASFAESVGQATARILLNSLDEEQTAPGKASQLVFRVTRGQQNSPRDRARLTLSHQGREVLAMLARGESAPTFGSEQNTLRHLLFAFHPSSERIQVEIFGGALSHAGQPAPDAINSFHDDPEKFKNLQERFREDYGLFLVLLDHQGTHLEIGTAAEDLPKDLPTREKRKERHDAVERWKKRSGYVPLSAAGDGMKAKTRLMMSLFEPLEHVLFIDEPELHLYHKQRRALGRHLVELASGEGKQVFVVTHDATFVQGALEGLASGADVQLIRMKFGSDRKTRVFLQKPLDQARLTPGRRQEETLAALFFEGVVLVEGAQDRAFYQEVRDIFKLASRTEIGFVSTWGLDRMEVVARFCADLEVPYQCVTDFDILLKLDPDKLAKAKRTNQKMPPSSTCWLQARLLSTLALLRPASHGPNRNRPSHSRRTVWMHSVERARHTRR